MKDQRARPKSLAATKRSQSRHWLKHHARAKVLQTTQFERPLELRVTIASSLARSTSLLTAGVKPGRVKCPIRRDSRNRITVNNRTAKSNYAIVRVTLLPIRHYQHGVTYSWRMRPPS